MEKYEKSEIWLQNFISCYLVCTVEVHKCPFDKKCRPMTHAEGSQPETPPMLHSITENNKRFDIEGGTFGRMIFPSPG